VEGEEYLHKAGKLPKELVDVECPRCGHRISEDSEVSFNREDSFIVGYQLKCPQCGNEFLYTLYFK
jgi:DNA-directed RNA polymerase subunit RPC12/RpoP